MKVINLCGGPCCGKSTTAAGLFSLMKLSTAFKVEQVQEVIKHHVYDENTMVLQDQVLITAEQNHKLLQLEGKVDFAISDASLLNGTVYNTFYGVDNSVSDKLALDLYANYDNVVFLLPRKPTYDAYGRTQSEQEAKSIDEIFITVLEAYRIEYYDMREYTHNELPEKILEIIKTFN